MPETDKRDIGLDYNDQCDIVFGRMRRLIATTPDLDPLGMTLDGMLEAGLKVGALGVSVAQVDAVFATVKAEALALREFRESVEDAHGVISNASDWDLDKRRDWRAAAKAWTDRYYGMAAVKPEEADIECPACSRASGADRAVHHAPPACPSLEPVPPPHDDDRCGWSGMGTCPECGEEVGRLA